MCKNVGACMYITQKHNHTWLGFIIIFSRHAFLFIFNLMVYHADPRSVLLRPLRVLISHQVLLFEKQVISTPFLFWTASCSPIECHFLQGRVHLQAVFLEEKLLLT